MWLKRLHVLNFKNYEEATLELSPTINVFAGSNGSGKTNLLDAIHYLALCKSYFNPIDSQHIRTDADWFMVQGEFEKVGVMDSVSCSIKKSQKKVFKKNQKEYPRLADHIGQFPLVMISPYDHMIITEGSEERRKFMDNVLSQTDPHYLEQLIRYNKCLVQRNSLLKQAGQTGFLDLSLLEIFDEQLVDLGKSIYRKRVGFLDQFIVEFQKYYTFISEEVEAVQLIYDSPLHDADFAKLLKDALEKDRTLERTTVGIHKDDLVFFIHDGMPLKKFGSQGQQKSFLVALKLAQFAFLDKQKGFKPLLLLDDIFDKLDEKRMRRLMQMVSENDFGQILITDTDASRIKRIFEEIAIKISVFRIESGRVDWPEKELKHTLHTQK